MTLSPVFRSLESLEFLTNRGYLELFQPSIADLTQARKTISTILEEHYHPGFLGSTLSVDPIQVFQEDFFLVLFQAINKVGNAKYKSFYAPLNYCIRGRITALDNLLDNENKTTLPFSSDLTGPVRSLVELEAYQLLTAILAHEFPKETYLQIISELYNQSLEIGELEQKEQSGASEILTPDAMIPAVHRIRGGILFRLGMIAPLKLEYGCYFTNAADALDDIGTAFQIVDDLVDFTDDLRNKSQNLLLSEIAHHGSTDERRYLHAMQSDSTYRPTVNTHFPDSIKRTIQHAKEIAESGFLKLQNYGFWYKPADTLPFLAAILGDKGANLQRDLFINS